MKNELILMGVTVLAVILCFLGISRNSLTLDEVNTLIISRNFNSMLSILWNDEANMWFYHLLMNLWLKLGDSVIVMRSLSAIFGILTVPVFYKLCRQITDKSTARISTFLLTINLYFLLYGQTARSYSMSLFSTTLMGYFFIKFAKNTDSFINLVSYCFFAVVSIYSYLLTGLVIVAQIASLFFLPKTIPWKKIVIGCLIIFIPVIPLLISPAFHGQQMDWLEKPSITYLIMAFVMLGGDSLAVAFISLITIGLYLRNQFRLLAKPVWNRFILILLVSWSFFPLVSGFLLSIFVKPIFEPESFNFSLPAFVILLGLGLNQIKYKQKLYSLLIILITVFSLIRLIAWYGDYDKPHLVVDNKSQRDWKFVAEYIDKLGKEDDAIIFYSYYIHNPFQYYFDSHSSVHKAKVLEIASASYPINGGTVLPEADFAVLDNLSNRYKRVWLILSYNNFEKLHRKEQEKKIENELERYYSLDNQLQFNQIEVKEFRRKVI